MQQSEVEDALVALDDDALVDAIAIGTNLEDENIEVINTAAEVIVTDNDDSSSFPLWVVIGVAIGGCAFGIAIFALAMKVRSSLQGPSSGRCEHELGHIKRDSATYSSNPLHGSRANTEI